MNNNEQTDEKSNKTVVEIPSVNAIADYLQSIGFLISLIDEQHLTENFTERKHSESYALTQICNAGRLIQDLTEGLHGRLIEIAEKTATLTGNNPAIVSLNLPITTTERTFQTILSLLNFNAPLPPLTEVDQINLQISIENGGASDES